MNKQNVSLNELEGLSIVALVIFILALFLCLVSLAKNNNTFKNHTIIIDAIYKYKMDCISKMECARVDYYDMEPYYETLKRVFDWGYKKILPPEKFEVIKPYIEEEKKCRK